MSLQQDFEKGYYDKIIREWEKDNQQIDTDPESSFVLAASNFRLGNFEAACSICEKIYGVFSENPSFLAMYAAVLRRLTLFERATDVFKKALEISPEAKEVRNNYSNLLIDQRKYDDAEKILLELVKEDPEYKDAALNLERLSGLKNEYINECKVKNSAAKEGDIFGDPLDEAFTTNEVVKCGSKVGSLSASVDKLLPEGSKCELEEADLELIKLANKQLEAKQFNGAMQIIEKIRSRKGRYSSLYKLASDSCIGLQRFREAEIHGLMAYINGEYTTANFLNLASLAAMRKDQLMASHWLNEAKKIDQSDNNYLQSKELLFPNGKAREVDRPFSL